MNSRGGKLRRCGGSALGPGPAPSLADRPLGLHRAGETRRGRSHHQATFREGKRRGVIHAFLKRSKARKGAEYDWIVVPEGQRRATGMNLFCLLPVLLRTCLPRRLTLQDLARQSPSCIVRLSWRARSSSQQYLRLLGLTPPARTWGARRSIGVVETSALQGCFHCQLA